jgi:AraC family transcriptional regulator, arabinose operon regulatory protein
LSVSEIAEQLGYRDLFFFSRQFMQKEGMSPTEYRGKF